MIPVTRLDGGPLVVNADLIPTIESTPDTALALINGDKLFVRESPDEVITRVRTYRQQVAHGSLPAAPRRDLNGT
jgi:flagellar protein FlbD